MIASNADQVFAVEFGQDIDAMKTAFYNRYPDFYKMNVLHQDLIDQVLSVIDGNSTTFDDAIQFNTGTKFQQKVWHALRSIEY